MISYATVSCILLLLHNVCCYQDNFIEPHAWAKVAPTKLTNTPEGFNQGLLSEEKSLGTRDDQLAFIYFKKFLYELFSREALMASLIACHQQMTNHSYVIRSYHF